jgi:integrase/recombinase XerD
MKFSDAKEGFVFSRHANLMATATIQLYDHNLTVLMDFLNNPNVEKISDNDIAKFFYYLRYEYKPIRKNHSQEPLSASSMRNHWKAIRSFFGWCLEEGYVGKNPSLKIKCPKENSEEVCPFSKDEVLALLKHAEFANPSAPSNRKSFVMKRRTGLRDIAMIFVLIETGIRVGELCRLRYCDFDFATRKLHIAAKEYSDRKTKSRDIYLTDVTISKLWTFIADRKKKNEKRGIAINSNDPLFVSSTGIAMTPNSVRLLFADLGKKAGVNDVHPHRFRHTCATEFLRNGGNVFSIQKILGHADLSMVKNYAQLVQADIENAQKTYSPVVGWMLNSVKATA